mmetsp:Transcript_71622/g.219347  ORF Transcript_71622/g.219347 Transcript_71622/m.219347 type:complete len:239 (+) Transcript_71622:208-924(+)
MNRTTSAAVRPCHMEAISEPGVCSTPITAHAIKFMQKHMEQHAPWSVLRFSDRPANATNSSVILKNRTNSWMSISPLLSRSISSMIRSMAASDGLNPHACSADANSSFVMVPVASSSTSSNAASNSETGIGARDSGEVPQSITFCRIGYSFLASSSPSSSTADRSRDVPEFTRVHWRCANSSARTSSATRLSRKRSNRLGGGGGATYRCSSALGVALFAPQIAKVEANALQMSAKNAK